MQGGLLARANRTGWHAMTEIKMLTSDEKVAEIRRLYFQTTRHTIEQDLDRALGLLKSMNSEDERGRATVYMEGLAQMRADWDRNRKKQTARGKRHR
jgi:hypothetical protein